MFEGKSVAVVIPAYDEEQLVGSTIESLPDFVDRIIVIDDASRDATGERASAADERVELLRHERNQGVGAATMTGYRRAVAEEFEITCVMNADGQMDPEDLETLVRAVASDECDYAKANRLSTGQAWKVIPRSRYIGNAVLWVLTKIASGYWHVADSQAGYTALSLGALRRLDLERLYRRYGFPNDMLVHLNVWNRRVDSLPVAANSATLINTIGAGSRGHPDFGEYLGYGIPVNIVDSSTPRSSVSFTWPDESDAGPYPIPPSPRIEGGSDRHILMWDLEACRLYELFAAHRSSSGWQAGSGAIWNLRSNALRPDGWTSADAAGLPILAGLVRYEEVAAGAINHAIRFTAPVTRDAHIYPARHHAGAGSSSSLPPMGTRVRLKAGFDMADYSPRMRVILVAMQRYGMILADNGSPWYFSGASDIRWDDEELNQLKQLRGSDFEVVNTTGFVNGG
jgi:hypothetical protein